MELWWLCMISFEVLADVKTKDSTTTYTRYNSEGTTIGLSSYWYSYNMEVWSASGCRLLFQILNYNTKHHYSLNCITKIPIVQELQATFYIQFATMRCLRLIIPAHFITSYLLLRCSYTITSIFVAKSL